MVTPQTPGKRIEENLTIAQSDWNAIEKKKNNNILTDSGVQQVIFIYICFHIFGFEPDEVMVCKRRTIVVSKKTIPTYDSTEKNKKINKIIDRHIVKEKNAIVCVSEYLLR